MKTFCIGELECAASGSERQLQLRWFSRLQEFVSVHHYQGSPRLVTEASVRRPHDEGLSLTLLGVVAEFAVIILLPWI